MVESRGKNRVAHAQGLTHVDARHLGRGQAARAGAAARHEAAGGLPEAGRCGPSSSCRRSGTRAALRSRRQPPAGSRSAGAAGRQEALSPAARDVRQPIAAWCVPLLRSWPSPTPMSGEPRTAGPCRSHLGQPCMHSRVVMTQHAGKARKCAVAAQGRMRARRWLRRSWQRQQPRAPEQAGPHLGSPRRRAQPPPLQLSRPLAALSSEQHRHGSCLAR